MVLQDVIKTRVQTWDLSPHRQTPSIPADSQPLLSGHHGKHPISSRPSTFQIAREAYTTEGVSVFFRGLGVCSARAFIVNAVQWAVSKTKSFGFTPTHSLTIADAGLRVLDETAVTVRL